MESESIVYGCIRDFPAADPEQNRLRRAGNRRVLESLPPSDGWPLIGRQMFSFCGGEEAGLYYQTQVIHFGASYRAVEYEWALWVRDFESLLRRLWWSSAVVHLETEMRGAHTFRWESELEGHCPDGAAPRMRCAWERESGLSG